MRNRLMMAVLAGVGLLVVSVLAFAHHGNAAYDDTKSVTAKGTVTDWIWANPHCWLKFDVTDDKGNVVHWVAETSNPSDMVDRGWAKTSFKPGDEITVSMHTVKNGQPVGRIQQVVLASGQILSSQLPKDSKPAGDVAKP